ncbi:hypothetical protein [Silvibacterium sp.]|uniref:hypothetical protein n=1 Tax=Silvibacterium sp. TaxID=1964179 RepID=UPI0039E4BD05
MPAKATEQTKQKFADVARDAVTKTDAAKAFAEDRAGAVKRNRVIAGTVAGTIGAGGAWLRLSHLLGE